MRSGGLSEGRLGSCDREGEEDSTVARDFQQDPASTSRVLH